MMYQEIKNTINDLFSLVDRRMGLKGGDVKPSDNEQLERAYEMINEVMVRWIKENNY